jgi:hypothetical protein
MGNVEDDDAWRARPRGGQEIVRRGDRVLVAIARVELYVSDLDPLDRLICLNQCLRNALDDGAGGR